ncbi:hypothetical protein [Yersinia ruckeri]|uniref:hypothetical protein n=1 Tax=Yersinia ruckeri TaxID=29486 RepID=UPI00223729A0|nr:hypothetical protein [Yersinia ruckeri]MCW6598690.1 hypothetical protein [Yersinia ruckeri]
MYKIVNLNSSTLEVCGEDLEQGAAVYPAELTQKELLLYKAGLVAISNVVKPAEKIPPKSNTKVAHLVSNGHPVPFLDYSSKTHRLKQD